MAIDGSNVYWVDSGDLAANNGAVMQIALSSPNAPVPLATSQPNPRGIAVDSTSVYWSIPFNAQQSPASGEIRKISVGGGSITPLATGQDLPGPIARDASFVYWANAGMDNPAIKKVAKGVGPTLDVRTGIYPGAGGLAVNSNNAFVTLSFMAINRVERISLDGSGEFILGSGAPGKIAVDSTNVYWTDGGNNAVHKAAVGAIDTSTAADVAINQSAPVGVAVDPTGVYWTNSSNGTVMKLAVGQTVPVPLAQGQSTPWAIIVDATTVYWVNNVADGAVMKLAK
jgi:hypothetical protein